MIFIIIVSLGTNGLKWSVLAACYNCFLTKSYTPWREGPDGRHIKYKNYIVLYTQNHKSQIGEFGTRPPVAVTEWSECCAVSLKVPDSILGQDSCAMFYI